MKSLIEDLKQIYKSERLMLVLMIVTLIISIVLLVFSLIKLSPESIVVKIGYGDIGGYRSGGWAEMLAFSILAFVFGILHFQRFQVRFIQFYEFKHTSKFEWLSVFTCDYNTAI